MSKVSEKSFALLLAASLCGCSAQEPPVSPDPEASGETGPIDPDLEARARAEVARPLEEQSADVQAKFAEAKRLMQQSRRDALADALAQVEASIEAGKGSGAPAAELERLSTEAASLRARMEQH